MSAEERQKLIARYAQGYAEVAEALRGFGEADLSAHPIPGKWSAREIVQHLADSETISAQRLRKLLVEEHAVVQAYDQEAYARRLRYNERDIAPALEAFRAARATTLQVIEAMSAEDWQRRGWHTEGGLYTPETWLAIYAGHAHDHADQIRRLRKALGREP